MACPLFLPASSPNDLYGGLALAGRCAAEVIHVPIDDDKLRTCCNVGYARGSCARAAQSDADAFRFLIKENRDGTIDVAWSSERNHHPIAVGTLVVSADSTQEDGPLERQARACAEAYLRQIGS